MFVYLVVPFRYLVNYDPEIRIHAWNSSVAPGVCMYSFRFLREKDFPKVNLDSLITLSYVGIQ